MCNLCSRADTIQFLSRLDLEEPEPATELLAIMLRESGWSEDEILQLCKSHGIEVGINV